MKIHPKFLHLVLLSGLLLAFLAACGPHQKFVAPEIDPPADLIPSYVPEGFELISGFQIEALDESPARFVIQTDDGRTTCREGLVRPFIDMKSPAGNDLLGIYYQNKSDDRILLITKSSFPGGSFDLWRTTYETSYAQSCDCDCDCDCCQIVIGVPLPLRIAEIREVRTVAGTQVAVLETAAGMITVFVRGEYLITVKGDLPLEEHLRIVESLLQ